MQKIDNAALILVPEDKGSIWSEDLLFQPLLRVVSWTLMRADVDTVIFDGPEEFRALITAVFPEDKVVTSDGIAGWEVDRTIALPAPAFIPIDSARSLLETADTLGTVRLARNGETIAYAAPGLLTADDILNADDSESCVMDADDGCILIDDYEALSIAEERANALVCRRLQRSGVRIVRPSTVSIGAYSIVERGATILPGSIIRHGSVIHSGAVIGPNAVIDNSEIMSGAVINASQVYSSTVGENTTVGPFAHIRPECDIGANCRIGAYVEVKKSNIGDGTKSAHLTFIGDADVGKNVNFGCGTITSNYDGLKKHRTTIEDEAFIGCNSNLIAPVKIGKGAYTAAGATVTKDVPPMSLAIGRPEMVIKEGWATRLMALREKARQEKKH